MITIFTKERCTECERIKGELTEKGVEFTTVDMKGLEPSKLFQLRKDARDNKQMSMPLIYVDDVFVVTSKFEKKYLG